MSKLHNLTPQILNSKCFRAAGAVAVIVASTMVAGFDALPNEKSFAPVCSAPIKFRIGAVDPRFGLSRVDVQAAIQQAGDLWGTAVHRSLIEYDPKAELAVNLVYDEEQEAAKTYGKGLTDHGAPGIKLSAGHYAEEDGTKRIDIFQFKDRHDLSLVLAHELGHAMGVEHNLNSQSIMKPFIVTRALALSPDDLGGLKAVSAPGRCEEASLRSNRVL